MHLINQSPYNTRVLRRAAVAAYRSLGWKDPPPWWKRLRIYVVPAGAHLPELQFGPSLGQIYVRVPKLTGNEWHQTLRDVADANTLTTEKFAVQIKSQISRANVSWAVDAKWLKHLPIVVPLKQMKSAPVRDLLGERYVRTVELERAWLRKQKLAGTKVKLYRVKRRYYEKRLAARKEAE